MKFLFKFFEWDFNLTFFSFNLLINYFFETALQAAIKNDNIDIVVYLLYCNKIDINKRDSEGFF